MTSCTTGKWKGVMDVAVKTMRQGAMSVENFLKEAEVMKTLRHPRLVTLYAVCTQGTPVPRFELPWGVVGGSNPQLLSSPSSSLVLHPGLGVDGPSGSFVPKVNF